MRPLNVAIGLGLVLSVAVGFTTAVADNCEGSGGVSGGVIGVGVVCSNPGGASPVTSTPGTGSSLLPYVDYRWASMCAGDPDVPPGDATCTSSLTCETTEETRWQLWGRLTNGQWQTIRTQCFGGTPPEFEPPRVTPAMVLSALRRVGLPELTTFVQPDTKTLVNFDTIFYTDPEPVIVDLTILGQGVEVEASPTSYRWVFGDGTEATTETAGAPFPSKEIVHRYVDADVTVHPHVETVYSARFRVGGGGWQEIGETVTTVGPAAELRVVEGTPLLSTAGR